MLDIPQVLENAQKIHAGVLTMAKLLAQGCGAEDDRFNVILFLKSPLRAP